MADKSSKNVTETLVNPTLVSVVGVASTENKKHCTPVKKSTTDAKLEAMDQK